MLGKRDNKPDCQLIFRCQMHFKLIMREMTVKKFGFINGTPNITQRVFFDRNYDSKQDVGY